MSTKIFFCFLLALEMTPRTRPHAHTGYLIPYKYSNKIIPLHKGMEYVSLQPAGHYVAQGVEVIRSQLDRTCVAEQESPDGAVRHLDPYHALAYRPPVLSPDGVYIS